ncbi:integration host factor beta subunit [Liberibacter crescens BT-1]|uniref:Integration host factor beta subunit n=1 Tax=Liberibacter crescens (strain BT-1) TaxID=1215343 RepID=L0EY35_LIBCB|nr:integration host factor subunit beta [Liberibacter crescens]AGA65296.1 integration host factor beta subunit [Liberibacter crescens BT-1]AMC13229.1 integration host factor subunit beta [Liberibacter crescens]
MIKSELVKIIAEKNPHIRQIDIENIVNVVLDEISGALALGQRIELRGFGIFSVKNCHSRIARNPRTGEKLFIEEKWMPVFKVGKELCKRLNLQSDSNIK